MQEELNSRTMTIMIETGRLTTSVLQKAIRGTLNTARSTVRGIQAAPHKGKQTLSSLKKQGVSLSNVEITKDNIKSFDTVAKKYKIDYALMKQKNCEPPRFYVFFKGADAEVLDAAFKEYAKKEFKLDEKGTLKDVLEDIDKKRSEKLPEKKRARAKTKTKVKSKTKVKVPELKR